MSKDNYELKGSNWCKERNALIGTDQDDTYTLVDVHLYSTITLACHYCSNVPNDALPKLWYKKERGSKMKEQEIETDFSDSELNNIFTMPDHTLVIRNISEKDDGIYFCHGPLGEDSDFNYNYVVDIISHYNSKKKIEDTWKSHKRDKTEMHMFHKIDELNTKFRESYESDYIKLRREGVLMNVISPWAQWEPCNGCLRLRKRKRKCYIRPTLISNDTKVIEESKIKYIANQKIKKEEMDEREFLLEYNFACRSLRLAKLFPIIANDLQAIPEYNINETCFGQCLKYRRKEGKPKYENLFVMTQGTSATFICPESTYNDKVTWEKNGFLIESARKDPHLQLDIFATLYLRSVTEKQSGSYTCSINKEPIQQINIVVTSKSIFQTQEFYHHLQYLGLIFIISFFIYLIGVISACTQKKRFKITNFNRKPKTMAKSKSVNRNEKKSSTVNDV